MINASPSFLGHIRGANFSRNENMNKMKVLKAVSYCHLALENVRTCIRGMELHASDKEFIENTFSEALEKLSFVADQLQDQ